MSVRSDLACHTARGSATQGPAWPGQAGRTGGGVPRLWQTWGQYQGPAGHQGQWNQAGVTARAQGPRRECREPEGKRWAWGLSWRWRPGRSHLGGEAAAFLPPGDGGTGHTRGPTVQPDRPAFVHLGPLRAHLDPGPTAPCRQCPVRTVLGPPTAPGRPQPGPLTVHLKHGPGHVLPGAAEAPAQVLGLIRGLDRWQAQDATVNLCLLRELATRAP